MTLQRLPDPLLNPTTIIDRALAIAPSGSCHSVNQLRQLLKREGFDNIERDLQGDALNRQLIDTIKGAGLS